MGGAVRLTPENYPTTLRTTGMGWASAMTRIAAALVTLLGATVIAGSMALAIALFGAAFLAGAALGRETRGRPLQDVSALSVQTSTTTGRIIGRRRSLL